MAEHIVKCPYCGKTFNRDKVPYVMVGRRYAHVECAEKAEQEKTQEEKDKDEVYLACKRIFGKELDYVQTMKLLDKYTDPNGNYKYSYSGVLHTLVYYYEVLKNPVTKESRGTIGIVPYIYKQAYNYYYKIWFAQMKTEDINIVDFKPKEVTINIEDPSCEIKKRKLFSFLDKE